MAYRKSKKRSKAIIRARKEAERRETAHRANPELGMLENYFEILQQATENYDGFSDVDAFLESELERLIVQLRRLAKSFDPARVIGALRMMSFASARNEVSDHAETGADYSISLVEAATVILYCGAQLDTPDSYSEPAIGEGGLGELAEESFENLRRIRMVVTLLQLNKAWQISPQAHIAARHSLARQWIRETTYSSVLMEINQNLFNVGEINELITDFRSYNFEQIDKVFAWLTRITDERFKKASTQFFELFGRRSHQAEDNAEQAKHALTQMLAPTFKGVTVSAFEIAQDTGLSVQIVQRILEDFSIELTELPEHQAGLILAEGSNPLFKFPLVRERENRFLIPDEALLAPSIRRNLEASLLTTQTSQNRYANHRGRFLETRLSEVLGQFFPQATLYENIKYRSVHSGRGEADVVLELGHVAIIFEAKAGTIFKSGEAFTVYEFRNRLHRNISQASNQLERMRHVIEMTKSIPRERGQPIDLSEVREVHTVIVTLDELLDLSAQPLDLIDAQVLEEGDQLPWVVSIGDLQLILSLITEPSELLVYLRRRRDPVIAKKYMSTDELDLFQLFRQTGLWAEDKTEAGIPTLVTSMTAEVDAWFHGEGQSQPAMKETPFLRFVRQARSKELPHWFEFGAALISIDETVQEEISYEIDRIVNQSRTDFFPHSLTLLFEDRSPTLPGCLLVFKSKGVIQFAEERDGFARYLQAKKTQCEAGRAFGCVLDRKGALADLFYESGEYSASDFSAEEWSRLKTQHDNSRPTKG